MARPSHLILVASALAVVGGACGSDDPDPTAGVTGVTGDVVVFAAASLTTAFTEIGEAFAAEHPGSAVTFNFAGSSGLVAQIGEGAPADVFASADLANMTKLTDVGGAATAPVVFATNVAEIVVAAGNPAGITAVADLADGGLVVVLCAPDVPCGSYAAQVLELAGVTVTPKSWEQNVNAVVSKVALGEADAGIVYATDVIAAGDDVEGVVIPANINVTVQYPIAITTEARNASGARAFVEFVIGGRAKQILLSHGFGAP